MQSHSISNGSVRLHVTTYGDPTAAPVILLHGFPDTADCWSRLVPLIAHQYYLIVPDGRGIHRSDAPIDIDAYAIAHLVADVIAIADALAPGQPFTLVGHDWGGVVAWAVVSLHPARVARAVLCNAPHPAIFLDALTHDENQLRASGYITALRSVDFERRFVANAYEIPLGAFASADLSVAEKAALQAAWELPGRVTGALNWYRAATFAVPGGTCDIPLPDGSVPTTLLWGANDTALLVSLAERHRATLPWLVVDILPEANHWLPRTHPDMIAHVLLPD